ncbi:MAG TPA: archaetidylserine decarboxylase [Steroidobacteraceae bacterium]|nr:archaetidylserine decarboxylase [Steroidobacteraceae bacterium]
MTGPAAEADGLAARAFIALQYLMPQHALSALVHAVTRSRAPRLKNFLIERFIAGYHPEMGDALEPDALKYASFNAFFTRALRPGARPIDPDPRVLVCPVDGAVSQSGPLQGNRLVQAKGHAYTLEALLDEAGSWADAFRGGWFATLYLAPFNYHRIHMPLEGTLRAAWYVPGCLFSVNTTTAASVPGLFTRNERIVCVFEQGTLAFAVVLVGALFVGSMSTVWHGDVTPRRPRRRTTLPLSSLAAPLRLEKGAELGRFNMGSTVILLLPPGAARWRALQCGGPVRVGEALAQLP